MPAVNARLGNESILCRFDWRKAFSILVEFLLSWQVLPVLLLAAIAGSIWLCMHQNDTTVYKGGNADKAIAEGALDSIPVAHIGSSGSILPAQSLLKTCMLQPQAVYGPVQPSAYNAATVCPEGVRLRTIVAR